MTRAGVIASAVFLALLLALPVSAQNVEWRTLGQALSDQRPDGPDMTSGTTATLRGLDKVSGALTDIAVAVDGTASFGRLTIDVRDCRYPADNPASDAVAFLTITDTLDGERQFQGWMFAASPALNALDHARYDIWVLSCE